MTRVPDDWTPEPGMEKTLRAWAEVIDKMPPGEARDSKRAEWESWRVNAGVENPVDTRTGPQQLYDRINGGLAPSAARSAASGYPAAIHPNAVDMWKKVSEPNPALPPPPVNAEDLAEIAGWLETAASREKAGELLTLAKRSELVMRALLAHARAAARYTASRPQG
jgi:hypothetical protein